MNSTALFSACVFLTVVSVFGSRPSESDEGSLKAMNPAAESPNTEPPPVLTAGLFAATTTGLVALNLQNLEATYLTTEPTYGVAVNHNLKKVYWSENSGYSRIMRSNFNGSANEIIYTLTGGYIFAMAVHEPSGSIYFTTWSSDEIGICNAIGEWESCYVILGSSTFANYVYSIAVDSENNVIYWSNYENVRTSLFRANLDGSGATRIASSFTPSTVVITFGQPSFDTLYWTDIYDNTIGTINANSSNKRTLVELEGKPGPVGIQVDGQKIYFGNYDSKTIQSVHRDSGERLTTLFNSTGRIYHLALY